MATLSTVLKLRTVLAGWEIKIQVVALSIVLVELKSYDFVML